jgi:hypothetical protein
VHNIQSTALIKGTVIVGNAAPGTFASWQMRFEQCPSAVVNIVAMACWYQLRWAGSDEFMRRALLRLPYLSVL